jgi:hypothetical protein
MSDDRRLGDSTDARFSAASTQAASASRPSVSSSSEEGPPSTATPPGGSTVRSARTGSQAMSSESKAARMTPDLGPCCSSVATTPPPALAIRRQGSNLPSTRSSWTRPTGHVSHGALYRPGRHIFQAVKGDCTGSEPFRESRIMEVGLRAAAGLCGGPGYCTGVDLRIGRVGRGGCPPRPPTDPGVPNSGTRLFVP